MSTPAVLPDVIPFVVRKPGDRVHYEYHCYEGEDSADALLWHRTHQQVTVLHEVPSDEAELYGPMYRVRFDDGFEGDTFNDELLDSPAEFERPDYTPRVS